MNSHARLAGKYLFFAVLPLAMAGAGLAQVPPPRDGFTIEISGDFSAMLRQAPVLDNQAAGFERYKAAQWLDSVQKLFAVALDETSPAMKKLLVRLQAGLQEKSDSPQPKASKILFSSFFQDPSRTREQKISDKYVSDYMILYLDDLQRLLDAAGPYENALESLQRRFGKSLTEVSPQEWLAVPRQERSTLRDPVANFERTIRPLIYRPTMSPVESAAREQLWEGAQVLLTKLAPAGP